MKMKKTLAFIMTAALTVGTMAGCSQATINYSQEISNTAKWEASTSNIQGTINIDVQGVKEQINITADGYKANDKSYVDMTFTDPTGKLNIPELKAYSDGTTNYINKGFYQGIYSLTGQTAPAALANIKEDYIGINTASTGVDVNKLKALATQPDSMVELGKLIFGENTDFDIPFVQNGREYTVNLDADQTVELGAKALKAAGNNLDNINNTFKLGLPAESITQMKATVNSADFDKGLADAKTALTGTSITSKEVFTDTSYTADFNMNLKIKDAGSILLTMKTTDTKSEVKEITFPTSTLKVTQEEFNKMLVPTDTTVSSTTTNVIAK
jgi:hypothetical protein